MDKTFVLRPRMSEKTYGLSQSRATYTFLVPPTASKQQVAAAVEAQFNVTVISTNMATVLGKAKRTIRKGGKISKGSEAKLKKAYVRLKEGDKLPVFAAVEEAEAEEAKQAEKTAKKLKKEEQK